MPENLRFGRQSGTAEIECSGCRTQVEVDVYATVKSRRDVGVCRVCGFPSLVAGDATADSADGAVRASGRKHAQSSPFVTVYGSAYEVAALDESLVFTPERAFLAGTAITLKRHRPEVFWSRTLPAIVVVIILCFALAAISAAFDLPWLAGVGVLALTYGLLSFHRRLIDLRTYADVRPRLSEFNKRFEIAEEEMTHAGLAGRGDFRMAARFLRRMRRANSQSM